MKTYKNQSLLLNQKIEYLERKRNFELNSIKKDFNLVIDSLKPGNIVNQALEDFKKTANLKQNIIEGALSLTGGYLSKKLLIGTSHSFFKKILGYAIQYGVTSFISKKVSND